MVPITARALLLVRAHGGMGQMESWCRANSSLNAPAGRTHGSEAVEPVAIHRSHRIRLETCPHLLAVPTLLTAGGSCCLHCCPRSSGRAPRCDVRGRRGGAATSFSSWGRASWASSPCGGFSPPRGSPARPPPRWSPAWDSRGPVNAAGTEERFWRDLLHQRAFPD